jgi:hypothetical protein
MDREEEGRKPYAKPEIVYEADLEIRAGTPLSPSTDLTDPSNLAP